MYVFDLEGVLVDTRESRRLAWSDVGVTASASSLGRPWHLWLPDMMEDPQKVMRTREDQAQQKHDAFMAKWPSRAHVSRALPLADLAVRLGNFALLTELTQPMTALVLMRTLGVDPSAVIIHHDLNVTLKLATLKERSRQGDYGVYVTTDASFACHARAVMTTQWVVMVAQCGEVV